MALTSRAQRERDQQRRMARGRRNLTQLVGPQSQGQRTPMNRGSGYVNTVQAPKFQQSTAGDDITTAGLAYKGGKGLFDFTQGKEAYIDEAGNSIKAVKPWTIGGESIGDTLSGYGDTLSGYADQTGEALSGLFSSSNPTAPAGSYGPAVGNQIIPGSNSALQAAEYANSPALQTMNKFGLGGPMSGATKLNTQLGSGYSGLGGQSGILGGMGDAVSASTVGSNLPSGGGAFSGANNLSSTSNLAGTNALQGPANATELAAEAGAGSDLMGTAGAALGAGLNIYDMTQQGVTAGNALGLGGSALLGLSNAWNPLGWAMLGTSAAGSLFDWW